MRLTNPEPPNALSMHESGSVPPGVGPAGGISAGGDLATVGVPAICEDPVVLFDGKIDKRRKIGRRWS
jgi:hypothetical protein